jgi:hypothetical protein
MLASALATAVVRARPTWPWARSLPWSSRHRVLGDTLLLGTALLVVPLSLLPLDWRSAAIVALVVPPMAVASCGSIRTGARRQTSAGGEIALYAALFGAAIAVWPWTAVLVVCVTPFVFQHALRRERRLLVTRWEELHHDAAGDPAWMSAS